jgi:hypothetical protein
VVIVIVVIAIILSISYSSSEEVVGTATSDLSEALSSRQDKNDAESGKYDKKSNSHTELNSGDANVSGNHLNSLTGEGHDGQRGTTSQHELRENTTENDAEENSSEKHANRRPTCTVYGTVTLDGEPRPGVSVFLTRWGFSTGAQVTKTNREGSYRFEKADWPVNSVSAKVPSGFGPGGIARCEEDDNIIKVDLDYKKAPVHVFGQVTDREDNPLADSVVGALDDSDEKNLMKELSFPTDSEGRFEFWLPEDAQKYVVFAQATGHLFDRKRIPPHRSDVELLFKLARESNIHGQVVGPEGPKPGVSIYGCDRTRSGRNGRFVLVCGPEPAGIGAWDSKMWGYVKVPPREEATDAYDVVVKLKSGKKITGLVKLKNGKPVAMAEVLFSCEDTGIFDVIQADMQGRFEIDGLPPDDTVWVQSAFDKRPGSKRGQRVDPKQSYVEILLVPDEE